MLSPGGRSAYGAKTIDTSAVLIADSRATRRSITVQNVHASNDLYVGSDSSVTSSNGVKVKAAESLRFDDYSGAVYGIGSAASTDVRYFEVY